MTTVDDIREQLRQLGLDTRGNKSTIKARLRKHLKKDPNQSKSFQTHDQARTNDTDENGSADSSTKETQVRDQEETQGQTTDLDETPRKPLHINSRYDYYLCFDVEATCEKGYSFEFPNEVIEFPVVLLDGSTFEVVDEFHSYVRPTNRPVLSEFCMELTGITQQTIDEAPTFTEVLSLFEDWLTKHNIILGEYTPPDNADPKGNTSKKAKKNKCKKSKKNHANNNPFQHPQSPAAINDFSYGATFCFVTDGPFDIRDFIGKQCLHSGIPRPSYFAQSYLDIRTLFRTYFDLIHWMNLEGMLKFLGETFEGRQHSGICDARMVGLIARRLANGFSFEQDDDDDDDGGDSIMNSAAIFREENKSYIATQWSDSKLQKLKAGCVLKANRGTNQTFVKMMPFQRLAKLEALPALVAAGASMPPPKKTTEREDLPDDEDDGQVNQEAEGFGEASSSFGNGLSPALSKISSPESSPRISPAKSVSFVQESMFAALMSD
ncbi:hypothetical protein EC968_000767 [Mortierella alpina]|nr:hypothetical protein EC968_000767 [Mortierella alpina]